MSSATHAFAVLLLAGMSACAAHPRGSSPVPAAADARIDSIITQAPLHRTHWGIHVVDAASGEVLYSRNAEQHFIPASNMKLVIGAVALARFGDAYRYRTDVRASPLTGDSVATLVVIGSGDPTWSARFRATASAPLDSIARAVARSGIAAVGDLVIDASRFSDALVHPTWEVSDLVGGSAPPVDAIAVAEATFRVILRGGTVAGAAGGYEVLSSTPQPVRAQVRTDTVAARSSVDVDYTARRDTVYIDASIAVDAVDTVTLAVTRPADVVSRALAGALARAGVRVHGARVFRDSIDALHLRDAAAHTVTTVASPSMAEIVAGMLSPSQNWIAEQLLKSVGAEFGGDGSWRGGATIERAWLSDVVGIDSAAVQLRDASGLSAQNLLTPSAVVTLLAYARAQTWGNTYRNGLAQPGSAGTLSNRLRPLAGRLFAKTGTITNVNSLSGYLAADSGRELIFSMFSNGSGVPSAIVRAAIDSVVMTLSRQPHE